MTDYAQAHIDQMVTETLANLEADPNVDNGAISPEIFKFRFEKMHEIRLSDSACIDMLKDNFMLKSAGKNKWRILELNEIGPKKNEPDELFPTDMKDEGLAIPETHAKPELPNEGMIAKDEFIKHMKEAGVEFNDDGNPGTCHGYFSSQDPNIMLNIMSGLDRQMEYIDDNNGGIKVLIILATCNFVANVILAILVFWKL